MDAAGFVLANLEAQIDAFKSVVQRMNEELSSMPEHEREQVEEASALLRKVRAGGIRTQIPVTVVRREVVG